MFMNVNCSLLLRDNSGPKLQWNEWPWYCDSLAGLLFSMRKDWVNISYKHPQSVAFRQEKAMSPIMPQEQSA